MPCPTFLKASRWEGGWTTHPRDACRAGENSEERPTPTRLRLADVPAWLRMPQSVVGRAATSGRY